MPASKLRTAMSCHGSPASRKRPVLLSPGTSVTPEENFSWNYMKAFTAQGRYWCAVTMPHHTFGDIQTAGEYLVHGIRRMHHRTGKRIAILGHSQGGMNPRWALRFWPDTRKMVDDLQELLGLRGVETGPLSADGVRGFELTGAEGPGRVVFLENLGPTTSLPAGEGDTVVLTLEASGDAPDGCAVLDLLSRRASGEGGVLLDSVREFCRKRGIRFQPGPWRYGGGLV